jgi:hypothetical protein
VLVHCASAIVVAELALIATRRTHAGDESECVVCLVVGIVGNYGMIPDSLKAHFLARLFQNSFCCSDNSDLVTTAFNYTFFMRYLTGKHQIYFCDSRNGPMRTV